VTVGKAVSLGVAGHSRGQLVYVTSTVDPNRRRAAASAVATSVAPEPSGPRTDPKASAGTPRDSK
jgi:hypothetical protein